jgi:hypothetical protein
MESLSIGGNRLIDTGTGFISGSYKVVASLVFLYNITQDSDDTAIRKFKTVRSFSGLFCTPLFKKLSDSTINRSINPYSVVTD